MSYSPKPRVAVDLDEIARQLSEPRPTVVPSAVPTGRGDPLAELAKIVGQDDPYNKLLGPTPAPQARAAGIQFPPAGPAAETYADEASYEPHYTDEAYDDTYPSEEQEDLVPLQPRRSRKGLIAVAGVLGVAAAAVGGALVFGGGSGFVPAGEPPVISAAQGPVKVQPQSPGGVEIPNQNKQIYERAAADTQTKVVNREEQPLDVRQAVRTAATSPELLATTAQPPVQNALAASLGEPRRVRTVSIRPDGSVISDASPVGAGSSASLAPATPAPSAQTPGVPPRAVLPTLTLPAAATTPSAAPATPAPAPRTAAAPSETPATAPSATAPSAVPATPAPRPAAATPAAATPAAPAAATPQPAATPAPTRVAAVPTATAPMSISPAATPAPAATAAPTAAATPSGGWAVQLGVRSSETDARSAFSQFQAKFPELKSESPIIRQAEVNGNTIYRVRVGPLSKDDASALCSKLQGAGGQCFVAKN